MEVHHLKVLRELGERGSVAAVARALHVTPSAVSQHLAALQRSARVPLTERRGRRLVLTDAGHALAAAGGDVVAALDRAAQVVNGYLDDLSVPVTLAGFHSVALTCFAPVLRHVAAAGGPPVRCADADVAQADFPALTADYDLVLAHRLNHSPPWPADRLAVVPLLYEPLYVALPAGHPLTARPELTATDVSTEPWISVHEGFPLEGTLSAIAAAAGRPLTIAHRINDFTVAAAVVASGAALALLPGYTTVRDPGVALRPLAGLPVGRHIDALARPEALSRRGVQAVLQVLHHVFAHDPAAGAPTGTTA
jgi:DNA-binding transcriptional LysR family regulator